MKSAREHEMERDLNRLLRQAGRVGVAQSGLVFDPMGPTMAQSLHEDVKAFLAKYAPVSAGDSPSFAPEACPKRENDLSHCFHQTNAEEFFVPYTSKIVREKCCFCAQKRERTITPAVVGLLSFNPKDHGPHLPQTRAVL